MIGKLINIFRVNNRIGVVDLANKLQISRVSLFRIENGLRQPSEKTAIRAFKILGLNEEEIYHVFVFNDLLARGEISAGARNREASAFLDRLIKKDKNSKIIYSYFKRALNAKRNA